jgi:thiol-disulfide isomerase/thioredoxin
MCTLGRQALIALTLLLVLGGEPAQSADPLAGLLVQVLPEPVAAPSLAFTTLDGRPLRLHDFHGKVVFLNFWATWCVPCRQEMPAMDRLYREFETRGLVVLAVNFAESKTEMQAFLNTVPVSFPIALDPAGAGPSTFGARGLPVTCLVDREGRIVWKAIGPRDWDSPASRAYFDKLLRDS